MSDTGERDGARGRALAVTVSDRAAAGVYPDTTGPLLVKALTELGFGSDGPYRDLPAYDGVIQGLVAFASVQGGAGTPALVRCIAADKTTGTTAVYAALAALFARERGRGGQHVELAMLDAVVSFLWADAAGNEVRSSVGYDRTRAWVGVASVDE